MKCIFANARIFIRRIALNLFCQPQPNKFDMTLIRSINIYMIQLSRSCNECRLIRSLIFENQIVNKGLFYRITPCTTLECLYQYWLLQLDSENYFICLKSNYGFIIIGSRNKKSKRHLKVFQEFITKGNDEQIFPHCSLRLYRHLNNLLNNNLL